MAKKSKDPMQLEDPLQTAQEPTAEAPWAPPMEGASSEAPNAPTPAPAGLALAQAPSSTPIAPQKFKVMKLHKLVWGGMIHHLVPGQVMSEATHGKGCIEKFKGMGVELEPVK